MPLPLGPAAILDFSDALRLVLESAATLTPSAERSQGIGNPPQAIETLPLLEAHTRILAHAIRADRDQPPFDRSTRDGFAIFLTPAEGAQASATWNVVGRLFAGGHWSGPPLRPGQAIEIMTGAPLPAGAAAVVMLEHVADSDPSGSEAASVHTITLAPGRPIAPGANVVPRGREAAAGTVVLPAHTPLNPAAIALAATCGAATVTVFPRPHVAIIATGDELVELNAAPPEPHQIRNSNSYALAALVTEAGGLPWRLPIARDTRESLASAIAEARAGADLLLFSGGVSVGKHDLVEEVLLSLGATFRFTGVHMQPGKPVVFGSLPTNGADARIPLFGLPGNPVSTEVTFRCFVAPLLRALAGERDAAPRFVLARLAEDVPPNPALTRLLPAHLAGGLADPTVRLVLWQGSGDLAANARANGYAILPPERERFLAGDLIPVLPR